jgi:hypothetical protein
MLGHILRHEGLMKTVLEGRVEGEIIGEDLGLNM